MKLHRISACLTGIALAAILFSVFPAAAAETVEIAELSPSDAYAMWLENPGKVMVIDSRTQEEYEFVGHAFMSHNIPILFWTGKWDKEKKLFEMENNPDFEARVKAKFSLDDTILIMCRSGSRSRIGAERLLKAGFKKVYSITNGFEGGMVTEQDSNFKGQRVKNGWKNSGLPWTCNLNSKLVYVR